MPTHYISSSVKKQSHYNKSDKVRRLRTEALLESTRAKISKPPKLLTDSAVFLDRLMGKVPGLQKYSDAFRERLSGPVALPEDIIKSRAAEAARTKKVRYGLSGLQRVKG